MHHGTLYIVATPIGNLGDISQRAIATLRHVDYIAAEDTRHSNRLLNHLGISKKMLALHDFNEQKQLAPLLRLLEQGHDIALISDAGTPLISDPGYHLVTTLREANIRICPIPGPCAFITALSASGLPTDRFIFEGFLPAKAGARLRRLEELQTEARTLIFYESPHRVLATLADLMQSFGANRAAVIARELTKTFETIRNGTLAQLLAWISAASKQQKGEFVILVHGAEKPEIAPRAEKILKILKEELSTKQAIELTAKITGEKKNRLKRIFE